MGFFDFVGAGKNTVYSKTGAKKTLSKLFGGGNEDYPDSPEYYQDPRFSAGIDRLNSLGNSLTNFDFSGNLSPLADTITVDPEILSQYFTGLQPQINQLRKQTISDLAANNQLESSVTADRLLQNDTDVMNQMQGYTAGLANQALQNRINLFGTGLNTLNTATGLASSNQEQLNSFNLANYENMVAQALSNQKGGLMGAIQGAMGGAMAGSSFGPIGMAVGGGLGGLSGYNTPQAGTSLLSSGTGLYAMNKYNTSNKNNPYSVLPGSSAKNNIWG